MQRRLLWVCTPAYLMERWWAPYHTRSLLIELEDSPSSCDNILSLAKGAAGRADFEGEGSDYWVFAHS